MTLAKTTVFPTTPRPNRLAQYDHENPFLDTHHAHRFTFRAAHFRRRNNTTEEERRREAARADFIRLMVLVNLFFIVLKFLVWE